MSDARLASVWTNLNKRISTFGKQVRIFGTTVSKAFQRNKASTTPRPSGSRNRPPLTRSVGTTAAFPDPDRLPSVEEPLRRNSDHLTDRVFPSTTEIGVQTRLDMAAGTSIRRPQGLMVYMPNQMVINAEEARVTDDSPEEQIRLLERRLRRRVKTERDRKLPIHKRQTLSSKLKRQSCMIPRNLPTVVSKVMPTSMVKDMAVPEGEEGAGVPVSRRDNITVIETVPVLREPGSSLDRRTAQVKLETYRRPASPERRFDADPPSRSRREVRGPKPSTRAPTTIIQPRFDTSGPSQTALSIRLYMQRKYARLMGRRSRRLLDGPQESHENVHGGTT